MSPRTYEPHPLYPCLGRWTFSLLPCLGYWKWCFSGHWGACMFWRAFLSFWWSPTFCSFLPFWDNVFLVMWKTPLPSLRTQRFAPIVFSCVANVASFVSIQILHLHWMFHDEFIFVWDKNPIPIPFYCPWASVLGHPRLVYCYGSISAFSICTLNSVCLYPASNAKLPSIERSHKPNHLPL